MLQVKVASKPIHGVLCNSQLVSELHHLLPHKVGPKPKLQDKANHLPPEDFLLSLLVDTHGTGKVDEKKLEKVLPQLFRLTPTNIRRTLKLNRPIYRRTASYGHFGRAPEKDGGFSWEKTALVSALKGAF